LNINASITLIDDLSTTFFSLEPDHHIRWQQQSLAIGYDGLAVKRESVFDQLQLKKALAAATVFSKPEEKKYRRFSATIL
jgi:hypothetical protein